MIAWYFVWAELLMWSTLIGFLILPVPMTAKYFVVKGFNTIWKSFYCRAFFAANLCIILFQLGDSYNQMLKYQAHKDALGAGMTTGAGSLGEKIDINMKLFRAQRNVYLSFFCLFEIFIFYGFANLIAQIQEARYPTKTSTKVEQKMNKLEKKIEKKNDEIRDKNADAKEDFKQDIKDNLKDNLKEIKKEVKVETPTVKATPTKKAVETPTVRATPTKKVVVESPISPPAEVLRSR